MSDSSVLGAIIAAMKARFGGISVANGYSTDIGAHVYHGRTNEWGDDEAGIDIRDGDSSVTELAGGESLISQEFEIEIHPPAGTTRAAAAAYLADVEKAISTDDRWGVSGCWDTRKTGHTFETDQNERLIASVKLRFAVDYAAAKWIF